MRRVFDGPPKNRPKWWAVEDSSHPTLKKAIALATTQDGSLFEDAEFGESELTVPDEGAQGGGDIADFVASQQIEHHVADGGQDLRAAPFRTRLRSSPKASSRT